MKKTDFKERKSIFRSEFVDNINLILFLIAFILFNAAFFNLFDLNNTNLNVSSNLNRVTDNLSILDSIKTSFDNIENGIFDIFCFGLKLFVE
jgi:hypothetical protein